MIRKNIQKSPNLEPQSLRKLGPKSKKSYLKKWSKKVCKKGRTGAQGHQEVAHATLKGGTVANPSNNKASCVANAAKRLLWCLYLTVHAAPYAMLARFRVPSSPAVDACTVCCSSCVRASAFFCCQDHSSAWLANRPSDIQQAERWILSMWRTCRQ